MQLRIKIWQELFLLPVGPLLLLGQTPGIMVESEKLNRLGIIRHNYMSYGQYSWLITINRG
jgi:hypothetical protein